VANLSISTVCNARCPYCFTLDHLARHGERGEGELRGKSFLPVEGLDRRLEFLARSGIREVRLLGGEPTLHPEFPALIERTTRAGFRLVVFSNGMMPEEALACLAALDPKQCTVLLNLNEPRGTGDGAVLDQQRATMRRLGARVQPGLNIWRTDFRPDFLLPLIAASGCKKVIRVGMAQPCLSGSNRHVTPNQYRSIAVKLVQFAGDAAGEGVSLDVDCGFVRCMFSDAEMESLRAWGAQMEWRCNPILDVGVDGDVIHCYPLSGLARIPLSEGVDAATLRREFEARTWLYRQAGVYRECSSCPLKARQECTGGCLAATIRRFRRGSFEPWAQASSKGGRAERLSAPKGEVPLPALSEVEA
jgi:radical SAM protein with 4Fe4S-binding SPASM domain